MRFFDTIKSMSPFGPARASIPPTPSTIMAAAEHSTTSTTTTATLAEESSSTVVPVPSEGTAFTARNAPAYLGPAPQPSSQYPDLMALLTTTPPGMRFASKSPSPQETKQASSSASSSLLPSSLSEVASSLAAPNAAASTNSHLDYPFLSSAAPTTQPTTTTATTLKKSTNNVEAASSIPPSRVSPKPEFPQFSAATEEILKRTKAGQAGYEAARQHVLKTLVTSDTLASQAFTPSPAPRGRGRPKGSSSKKRDQETPTSVVPAVGGRSITTPDSTELSAGRAKGSAHRRGSGKARGRGGGRGAKRRRDDSEEESTGEDSDGSSNYTPVATETKSGRKVSKPVQFVPTMPSPTAAPSKRRKMMLAPKQAVESVCKGCQRGYSPASNMIVFCDGCNTPWHQYCHDPPIEKEVIEIADKEWICKACKKAQEQAEFGIDGLIPGPDLLLEEKRAYFATLPQSHLVSLLCYATTLYPSLPFFHTDTQARLEALGIDTTAGRSVLSNGTKTHPAIASSSSAPQLLFLNNSNGGGSGAVDEEMEEDKWLTDPTAINFPRPGNGLLSRMRPESEDLPWLVDDNLEVFSHVVYKDLSTTAEADLEGE